MTDAIKALHREAERLARESFAANVTPERLVEIRDRLAVLDKEIYG